MENLQALEELNARLLSLDIGDLQGLQETLARRGEAVASLPRGMPVDRLRAAYQEGQRIHEKLLLAKAVLLAGLGGLNLQLALLRGIETQAGRAGRRAVASNF